MKKVLIFLCIVALTYNIAYAQQTMQAKTSINFSVENMYSTHRTNFTGGGLQAEKTISKLLDLGVGASFSYCKFHNDNYWNLYRLSFLPIYVTQTLHIWRHKKLHPYLHFREGATFKWYDKEFENKPGIIEKKRETGFYGYAGAGGTYKVAAKTNLFAELGLQSFHLSGNELEVNPHGVTGRIGVQLNLR